MGFVMKKLAYVYLYSIFVYLLIGVNNAHAFYNTGTALGTNTNELTPEDTSLPFVDLFKMSPPFEENRRWSHFTRGNVQYDPFGWPTRLNNGQVGTRFLGKIPEAALPEGFYTVLYDGDGLISYGNDASIYSRHHGKDIIFLTAGHDNIYNATLFIKEINEKNPLRNIRILMPGGICASNPFKRVDKAHQCARSDFKSFEKYSDSIIFNPDYLNFMKDFKVIRFMNMSGITRNAIQHWHQRNTLRSATWGGKEGTRGAPVEIMVALANKLNADPWFSMPHAASDEYIYQFAAYVRNNLRPNLKIYLEYTNETWNTVFDQAFYVREIGKELGLGEDEMMAGQRFYAHRSVEVFDIWQQAFGGLNRIVRVMSGWTVNTKITKTILSYQDAYKKTDAFAIAPYVFGDYRKLKKARSTSQVFGLLHNASLPYSLPSVLKYIKQQADITKKFGVDLIAYEGGQGLVIPRLKNEKSEQNRVLIQANRDHRMIQFYQQLLQGWKKAGGKLFVHFTAPQTYQRFGYFGTKEYINQPIHKAPKHRAILGFSKNNKCWWAGCNANTVYRHPKPNSMDAERYFAQND